jgi:hypothetical protein
MIDQGQMQTRKECRSSQCLLTPLEVLSLLGRPPADAVSTITVKLNLRYRSSVRHLIADKAIGHSGTENTSPSAGALIQ